MLLSVSSVGSLGLKPGREHAGAGLERSFSILSRIVGVETFALAADREGVLHFQYPQSDRWG